MTMKLKDFDIADCLKTEKDIETYIAVAFAEGDPKMISVALGDVARVRGMAKVARKAHVSRETLYRTLSKRGTIQLDTMMKIMAALGIKFPAPVVSAAA
ncbi:hypothetical protein FACS1894186_4530 [Alphaproteobacteria bacterium]|nr:hypothetical protein FACS1894186_4530 [Alphaproteobacteria bacterium]